MLGYNVEGKVKADKCFLGNDITSPMAIDAPISPGWPTKEIPSDHVPITLVADFIQPKL